MALFSVNCINGIDGVNGHPIGVRAIDVVSKLSSKPAFDLLIEYFKTPFLFFTQTVLRPRLLNNV